MSGKSGGSTTTQTNNYPPEYGQLLGLGKNVAETIYNKPADLPQLSIAGPSADQISGWQGVRDYVSDMPDLTDDWLGRLRTYADAPAQSITAGSVTPDKIFDQDIQGYMNPYVEAVVQPQLRNLEINLEKALNKTGAQATRAGGFGDARQGVLEGELYKDAQTARTDIVNRGFSDAWNQAVQRATEDIGRKLSSDIFNVQQGTDAQKTNVGLAEQALQRLFGGATAIPQAATVDQQTQLQALQALLAGGEQQRALGQQVNEAEYQKAMGDYAHLFNLLTALQGQANVSSRPMSTTTTSSGQRDNSGLGLLGSLGAALINKI